MNKKPRHGGARPVYPPDADVLKIGVARFDLRDPYHLAVALRWPAFVLVVLAAWLFINVVFALLYVAEPGSVANARPGVLGDVFFFSIETLATVGYGVMAPASTYGHVVSAIEILVGMAFTAVITGLIFVRFSRPRSKILCANNPVIGRFQGMPALMVRIGNGRRTALTDTTVRMSLLLVGATEDGRNFGRAHDLALQRSHFVLFALTWTLVHLIDETSILSTVNLAHIEDARLRLFVSIQAYDPAIGTMVRDVKTYRGEDIAYGMRYVDAVTFTGEGRTQADMSRLSMIETDPAMLES